jgi:hypothetical protein
MELSFCQSNLIQAQTTLKYLSRTFELYITHGVDDKWSNRLQILRLATGIETLSLLHTQPKYGKNNKYMVCWDIFLTWKYHRT